MTITGMLVVALATWQIVEIWHHGSLFEKPRARMERRLNWIGDLFSCPFCLSVWVGAAASALWLSEWGEWSRLVLYAFAVSRLANLGNDVTHDRCRTPGAKTAFPEEYEEVTEVLDDERTSKVDTPRNASAKTDGDWNSV